MTKGNITVADIRKEVEKNEAHHVHILREGLKASFLSRDDFQKWFAAELKRIGVEVEIFEVDPSELLEQPSQRKTLRENPSALNRGMNVMGRIRGKAKGKGGVLVFGHADKPPETYEWGKKHPDLVEKGSRLQGPGIADDVAGLTSLLSAMETYQHFKLEPEGDLLVASILGKQLGVFGTYGLVRRFGPVAGAIYMHPAESGNGLGDIKVASLGMAEFHITVTGKAPTTTEPHKTIYSRSGVSAIEKAMRLVEGIKVWTEEWARKPEIQHPELQKAVGQSFAVSFGRFLSGSDNLVYEIPKQAVLQGAINFPPSVKLAPVQKDFEEAVKHMAEADPWLKQGHVRLDWADVISESCEADIESEFVRIGRKAITDVTGKVPRYNYGHSVSDLRYPFLWWKANGFGVGPLAGDMNSETEYVDRKEYLDTISVVAEILKNAG
jgi:acetylornithine deacetylase/succinyl-diaminopimelate desuccinylase-like protein